MNTPDIAEISTGFAYGYNCPICGEPIIEPQPTEHTDEGLAHADCLDSREEIFPDLMDDIEE